MGFLGYNKILCMEESTQKTLMGTFNLELLWHFHYYSNILYETSN